MEQNPFFRGFSHHKSQDASLLHWKLSIAIMESFFITL